MLQSLETKIRVPRRAERVLGYRRRKMAPPTRLVDEVWVADSERRRVVRPPVVGRHLRRYPLVVLDLTARTFNISLSQRIHSTLVSDSEKIQQKSRSQIAQIAH